jgi:ankyrin repeat protein
LVLKSVAELKGRRHVAIARLLLDHGAKIDNVDVDGDTPISLAEQRGHADLVIMLEEEAAIRDLRAKEAAQ